ncbi:MAG TPA: thiolase family protein [Anaerolineales bacterium]|nr:thiolase family protein [Anaerolineales bacterium]
MAEVYLIEALRSPIGVGKPETGTLHSLLPVDLAARILRAVVERAALDPARIDDVILGCVTPMGDQGANIARLSALQAGFPVEVPGVQLNRMCGSGQQAIHFAAQAILAGDQDLVLAGGVEMMSRVPLGSDYPESWPQDFPYPLVHQGVSAEMMAQRWHLTRDALDDFAYRSHLRAAQARNDGAQAGQILPLDVVQGDGSMAHVEHDQGVRLSPDRARMGQLKPVFQADGVVTAGNSSQVSDGASAVLLASERAVRTHHLKPRARLAARVVVGSDPTLMLDGPIPATREVLRRAGLSIGDVDWIEINEAFACVPLAWQAEIGADPERINPQGGAIAHGHPLGATGGVLMTKLVHGLHATGGRYGLQTMCIGHGMATATVIERQ